MSLDATTLTVAEGSSVTITATLDIAPSGTASVGLNASGAIGSPGSCGVIPNADFTTNTAVFTFTGITTDTITFTACNDDDTDDETVTLVLTDLGINGLRLGSPTTVIVAITDDDEPQNNGDFGWGL